MKRLLPFSAVLLLAATSFQDGGPIPPPDGAPLSELRGPNSSRTLSVSGAPSVSAGGSHTCGVTTAGKAYCWGDNSDGMLGNGTWNGSNVPVEVSGGLTF